MINSEATVSDVVRQQLDMVDIANDRPLLIADADEVLFDFMACFDRYLNRHGAFFDWASYRLNGNIRHLSDRSPLGNLEVKDLIASFFRDETRAIDPIVGATQSLSALGERMQIVVLSNLPHDQHACRRHALVRHGMDYPLIANKGSKGPAVQALAARTRAAVVFIDDSPGHHQEVAELAAPVHRIHFVANERLSKLLAPAEHSHYRAQSWSDIEDYIGRHLDAQSY